VQGFIMLAYSTPSNRGRMISIFWIIYYLAGVLGGILSFTMNYNLNSDKVSPKTYIIFIVITLVGCFLSFLLVPVDKVQTEDLKPVEIPTASFFKEFKEIFCVFFNKRMVFLIPAFFYCDFSYTYQFNVLNAFVFNIRTRGFNNIFYFAINCGVSFLVGKILDKKHPKYVYTAILIMFNIIFLILYFMQKLFSREDDRWEVDIKSSQFAWCFFVYIGIGICTSAYQNWIAWIIADISDEPKILSRNFAFFVGFRSIGAAVSWLLDGVQLNYMDQLIANWVFFLISVPGIMKCLASVTRNQVFSVESPFSNNDTQRE
jgi:hypothetical protein